MLDAIGTPVVIDSVDLGGPWSGEVLVRIGAAAVCHSDQHPIDGHSPTVIPCVLGHEGAGEVAGIGSEVEKVQIGDRVVLNWLPGCATCFYCRRGQSHLCPELVASLWYVHGDGTSRLSRRGETIFHYSAVSTWAEYTVVPEVCCTVIDPTVPSEVAALIGCGGGHRGRGSPPPCRPRPRLASSGGGRRGRGPERDHGRGHGGDRTDSAVDRQPAKRDLAMMLRVTDFLAAGDSAVEQVLELTGGRGADVVFEAVENPRLQEAWIDGVRPGGTLVLVGMSAITDTSAFNCAALVRSEKTIKGSYFAASDPDRTIKELCTAYLEGRLPVDRLISSGSESRRSKLALDAMLASTEGRVAILFD